MSKNKAVTSYDGSPESTDTRSTPTPPLKMRWGVAADLNGFATRARQRHQPLASPRTGITHVPSHDVVEIRARESHAHNGLTATTRHDNVHEMEPLTDVVRNLQQSMSQVSSGLLQTAQTWANAGVCGGLCTCAVGGTFD